jgi:hypothetical protein
MTFLVSEYDVQVDTLLTNSAVGHKNFLSGVVGLTWFNDEVLFTFVP